MPTCVLRVGGSGGGGRIVLPILLSVAAAGRGTGGETLRRVWPDSTNTNRQVMNHRTDKHKHIHKNPHAGHTETCTETTDTRGNKVRHDSDQLCL